MYCSALCKQTLDVFIKRKVPSEALLGSVQTLKGSEPKISCDLLQSRLNISDNLIILLFIAL